MKKKVLEFEMSYMKTTVRTVVLTNDAAGMVVYVPKPFFAAAGMEPKEGSKFKLLLEEE